jgi:hypothetical protein
LIFKSCVMNTDLESRIVAFIDILGFRDLISRMGDGETELLKTVLSAFDAVERTEKQTYDDIGRLMMPTKEMTFFSDCIAISDLEENFFRVVLAARSLHVHLLFGGILTRGAIACGSTYHKKRIIFGEGLNRAYELERRAAVYPRIIVTDEIRMKLEKADAEIPVNISFLPMLTRDHDGVWFIDPFARPRSWEAYRDGEDPTKKAIEGWAKLRRSIADGLSRVQSSTPEQLDRVAKHRWLAQRFNTVLARESYQTGLSPISL